MEANKIAPWAANQGITEFPYTDFWFQFPSEELANVAFDAAANLGGSACVTARPSGEWWLVCSAPGIEDCKELQKTCEKFALDHGGRYDGFEITTDDAQLATTIGAHMAEHFKKVTVLNRDDLIVIGDTSELGRLS